MTPSRAFLVGAAAGLLLPTCAFGVVRRADVPDSSYIQLGKRAAFTPVGRIEVDYGSGYEAIGTATLVDGNRLVSAAHVFDSDALNGAVGVRVNFGHGRIENIDFQKAGVINIAPGWNPTSLRNDVSVVFLSQSFSIAPARLYAGPRIHLSTPITFVGYGNTGTGFTGSSQFSIIKRGGQNALDIYKMGGRDFEVDFDQPGNPSASSLGSPYPLPLEGLLGPGDSGGSVWVKRGHRWIMMGVNSYGIDWNNNGIQDSYGDRSGFVYLPRYVSWIRSLSSPSFSSSAERAVSAESAGFTSVALTSVPEPAATPVLLATLGVIAALGNQIRRLRANRN